MDFQFCFDHLYVALLASAATLIHILKKYLEERGKEGFVRSEFINKNADLWIVNMLICFIGTFVALATNLFGEEISTKDIVLASLAGYNFNSLITGAKNIIKH